MVLLKFQIYYCLAEFSRVLFLFYTNLKVTEDPEDEDEVWFEEAFDEDDKTLLELDGEIARLRFKLGLLLFPDQTPSKEKLGNVSMKFQFHEKKFILKIRNKLELKH